MRSVIPTCGLPLLLDVSSSQQSGHCSKVNSRPKPETKKSPCVGFMPIVNNVFPTSEKIPGVCEINTDMAVGGTGVDVSTRTRSPREMFHCLNSDAIENC